MKLSKTKYFMVNKDFVPPNDSDVTIKNEISIYGPDIYKEINAHYNPKRYKITGRYLLKAIVDEIYANYYENGTAFLPPNPPYCDYEGILVSSEKDVYDVVLRILRLNCKDLYRKVYLRYLQSITETTDLAYVYYTDRKLDRSIYDEAGWYFLDSDRFHKYVCVAGKNRFVCPPDKDNIELDIPIIKNSEEDVTISEVIENNEEANAKNNEEVVEIIKEKPKSNKNNKKPLTKKKNDAKIAS